TFRPGKEYSTTDVDSNGEYVYKTPTGDTAKTILMDGSYVESATAGMTTDQSTGKNSYVVQLKLKSDGDKNGKELFGTSPKNISTRQYQSGWTILCFRIRP
ncbi:Preprotein translocase subunit SecD, partial [human gut metagenome]